MGVGVADFVWFRIVRDDPGWSRLEYSQVEHFYLAITGPANIPGQAALSLAELEIPPGSVRDGCFGWYVDFARNAMIRKFLAGPWSHIAFVDADMIYPPDYLLRLARHRRPFVSGIYRLRLPPFPWGVRVPGKDEFYAGELPSVPFESRMAASGGWLCERRIFSEVLQDPWFVERADMPCDADLCERLPFPVLVDPSVRMDHLQMQRIEPGGVMPLAPFVEGDPVGGAIRRR